MMRMLVACAMMLIPLLALAQTKAPAPAAAAPKAGDPIRVLLVPENEAVISSQIAARIVALPAALGSRIRKGEILVRFDCAEQAARLKMSESELASARETNASKQELKSYRSASELDVRLAASAVDKAQAQVNVVKAQMGYCSISAPFGGRLVRLRARAHETVAAGQPLLDLIDNSAFRFQLHVPSRWLSWLGQGAAFTIMVDETGKSYPARVRVINGRVDPASRTVELTGAVEGKHPELIAGMSGTAQFNER
ncbi:efflux RND transporter periplasmic adaptor subunit [Massilia atriviolacea]|uniref:Efflux RND transporter periplasmic adaptor subunit n=1 Tax=Massilia atriviolacea TaxID=2495579 RepID=A0A430HGI3_9BURK|nr:efflux RND transporter periplasmic adaptor subunit [Massilia atriviolacea]RSZ56616.1 efflux RND transporter periplasmic adaptor subunit [Massilia atriviolacea]